MPSMALRENGKFYFFMLCSFLLAYWINSQTLHNPDVSWFLHITQRFLNGGTYLNDFFEINPPLILLFNIPAVVLHHFLKVDLSYFFQIYVFCLGLVSMYFCYQLVSNLSLGKQFNHLLLALLSIMFFILPVTMYGEREHLSLIFILPYCFLQMNRLDKITVSHRFSAWLGFFAAIGFGFKPHFLFALIFVNLYVIACRKKINSLWNAENRVLFLTLVLYLLVTGVFFPDYYQTLLMVYAKFFGLILNTHAYDVVVILATFGGVLLWLAIPGGLYKRYLGILVVCQLGYLAGYFIQYRFWGYQLLPVLMLNFLVTGLVLFALLKLTSLSQKTYVRLTLVLGVLFFCISFKSTYMHFQLGFYPAMVVSAAALMLGFYYFSQGVAFNHALLKIIVILGSAAVFSYMIRRTEWYAWHMIVTYVFALLVFLVFEKQKYLGLLFFLLLTAGFAYSVTGFIMRYDESKQYVFGLHPLISFLKTHGNQQKIYFINKSCLPFAAVDYSNATQVNRTLEMEWIDTAVEPTLKQTYLNNVVADLQRHQPSFIFVENQKIKNSRSFYLDYLKTSKSFAAVWANYTYTGTVNIGFSQLQVFARNR